MGDRDRTGLTPLAATGLALDMADAATGLALDMAGAAMVHARRKDPAMAFVAVGVLFFLDLFVAVGRFADL